MSPFLWLVIPPYLSEPQRHRRAREELNLFAEVDAGCFLTGHPLIQEPVGGASLGFGEERVYLFGAGSTPLGSVPYASIVLVAVESHELVLARFSESRLMRLGHRLRAFRTREVSDGSYVIVEWEGEDRQHHDGIFCFEGLAADTRARGLRDAILHFAWLSRRAGARPDHPAFAAMLDEFEMRRCEHCGKVHRPSSQARSAA
jgi:hypothetical protein